MKKKLTVVISTILSLSLVITSLNILGVLNSGENKVSFVHAQPSDSVKQESFGIQDKIDEATEDKKKLEEERKEIEEELKEVENKKDDVILYIESLDEKINKLSQKIVENKENISDTEREIESLKEEEEKAENYKINQYDTMKKRIKYMYENGNTDYVKLIFHSKSISDMLNRAEYVNKVTSYDNKILLKYKETCDDIKKNKEEVEINLELLKEYKTSLKEKKKSANVLIKRKGEELSEYQKAIGKSKEAIEKYKKQIDEKENELEQLLESQRQEIGRQEASSGGTPYGEASGDYCWPLSVAGRITSYFGYRNAPTKGASTYHKGVDIAVPVGTSVFSVQSGKVVSATYSASAGNFVSVYHGNGVYSYYMHCSSLRVSAGDSVKKGQEIALSGSTGISTGPHLHFAMFMNGGYVNPLGYISR